MPDLSPTLEALAHLPPIALVTLVSLGAFSLIAFVFWLVLHAQNAGKEDRS